METFCGSYSAHFGVKRSIKRRQTGLCKTTLSMQVMKGLKRGRETLGELGTN